MRWPGQSGRTGGIREPAVAGRFYTGRADRLAAEVDGYLADARSALAGKDRGDPARHIAIVVPHAGHVYSGPIAAFGYASLDPGTVRRVVLLGPAHFVPVAGIGLSTASAWRTPLGDVVLDADLAADLRAHFDSVRPADAAHEPEHSLEVQLPFLQRVLEPGWRLVPLIVGADLPEEVAGVMQRCARVPGTLIVVSTDLSHYLDHESAVARDRRTIEAILARRVGAIGRDDACGRYPLRGLLMAAAANDWRIRLLDARNSGDTAGDWDRVVGYAAFLVTEGAGSGGGHTESAGGAGSAGGTESAGGAGSAGGAAPSGPGAAVPPQPAAAASPAPAAGRIPAAARARMLALARSTIEQALETGGRRPRTDRTDWEPELREPGAAFVTLRSADGALLGCIGSLTAHQPLGADVAEHAFDAAFRDPRFPVMDAARAAGMVIDISVLSAPRPFPCRSYDDLRERLPVGAGLVVSAGRRRATFLPAVWEQLPDPDAFLSALWRKAGLRPGEWPDSTAIEVYEAEEFAESP